MVSIKSPRLASRATNGFDHKRLLQGQNGHRTRRIGVLAFDGVCGLELTGTVEAFTTSLELSRDVDAIDPYQVIVVGLKQRSFTSEGGVAFRTGTTTETAQPLDTIIVPGGRGTTEPRTVREASAWLADRAKEARRIAAICGGIYPLAHTGLLDGRNVTTHWRFAQDVAKRFPTLRVKSNASFLKDGRFYTCGSATAGIEMALSLVREDHGSEFALALARRLVMRLRRPGDEEAQVDVPVCDTTASDKIAELPAWIVGHLDYDLSVKALADRAGLCLRHFRRLFKSAFNRNPSDYVEQLRLQEASRRLHTSRASVHSIARSVGYASPEVFRRAFERWLGVSPRAYRRAFSRKATALNGGGSRNGGL
jgi:transcriptional regulator GlxA family with amidase domain